MTSLCGIVPTLICIRKRSLPKMLCWISAQLNLLDEILQAFLMTDSAPGVWVRDGFCKGIHAQLHGNLAFFIVVESGLR
jgi:hypothetical protein